MRRSTIPKLLVLVLALGLVGAACSKSNNSTSSGGGGTTPSASESSSSEGGGTITINGDKANDHGSKTVSGDSIEVEMDDFYFEPTTIQGTPGATVKLELKNEGSAVHNFSLTDQNVDQDVNAGEDANVTVTIPQSGTVEFFCKFHKSLGMVGQLSAS